MSVSMTLMRKALLAGSTNVWLRERATKAGSSAFRLPFHARRDDGRRPQSGGGAEAARDHDDPDASRREPHAHRGGRRSHAALLSGPRQGRRRRPRRACLGQADAARPGSGSRVVQAQSRSADRAHRAARQLPLDRHGELSVCRSDARAVPLCTRAQAPRSASRCRRTCIGHRRTSSRSSRSAPPSGS